MRKGNPNTMAAAILESRLSQICTELSEKLQRSGYFGSAFVILTDGRSLSMEYIQDPICSRFNDDLREAIDAVLSKYAEPCDLLQS